MSNTEPIPVRQTRGTLHAILQAKRDRGDPEEECEFFVNSAKKYTFGLNSSTPTAVFYERRAVESGNHFGEELAVRKRFLAMVEEFY